MHIDCVNNHYLCNVILRRMLTSGGKYRDCHEDGLSDCLLLIGYCWFESNPPHQTDNEVQERLTPILRGFGPDRQFLNYLF